MERHAMPTPMKKTRPLLLALLLTHVAGAACAADWQLVLSDRDRRIDVDHLRLEVTPDFAARSITSTATSGSGIALNGRNIQQAAGTTVSTLDPIRTNPEIETMKTVLAPLPIFSFPNPYKPLPY